MSTRAPASLRASGLFSSVKQADEKEEAPALALALADLAEASSLTSAAAALAAAASPEGAAATAANLDSSSCPPPTSSSSSSYPTTHPRPNAGARDAALIRLHASACHRSWAELPELARDALAAGCGQAELRATLRHLVICAGYAGSLAATSALSEAKLLGPATPGKVGGPPSDAFGLMYGREGSELVAKRLHRLDPVLARRLRQNVYGDLYADAGLPLSTRQLLMVSHLGEAGMQDELFGHAQAALLAGCSPRELVSAADAGFRAAAEAAEEAEEEEEAEETTEAAAGGAPRLLSRRRRVPGSRRREAYRATMATLEAAWARHRERFPGAAAAVKERERRRRKEEEESGGKGGGSSGSGESGGGDDASSSSPSSLLPQILVAGRDAAWWNRVPELDLEDFALGCERAPRKRS